MKTKNFGRGAWIATGIGALLLFALGDRVTTITRERIAAGTEPTKIIDAIQSDLLAAPFALSFDGPALIGGGIAAGILLLIVLYFVAGRQNTRPGEEQGSAAWGSPRDIAALSSKDRAARLQLTATEALSIDTKATRRNLNVCVIGASGTGKSRSYVMPNMLETRVSKAATDPKRELYRAMSGPLKERGYKVRKFDLIDLAQSNHFNPMSYFNPGAPETSIAQLTETIIANTSGEQSNGGDGFWERAERALLTALVAYVWATTPTTDETEPSLVGVVDLQKRMAANEGKSADSFQSEVDLAFEAARSIVEEWKQTPSSDDDETTMKVLDFACRQYRTFEQGAGETKKSIIISLGVRLAPLDMHDIREVIATDDMDIDQIGFELSALFLVIPDTHQAFKFLAALFWGSLFEKNIYLADHEESGQLPIPVHAFLDEFANIGKIPAFPILMSTIRSRGISASVIVQSHTQGKALWKDDWATIVANCDTVLFLGGRDYDTNKWLSQLIGDETVISEDTSRSYGMNGNYTKSQRSMKRALMTPDEIGVMDNDYALLLIRGLRPYKSRKADLSLVA